jgi:hypothetical protein
MRGLLPSNRSSLNPEENVIIRDRGAVLCLLLYTATCDGNTQACILILSEVMNAGNICYQPLGIGSGKLKGWSGTFYSIRRNWALWQGWEDLEAWESWHRWFTDAKVKSVKIVQVLQIVKNYAHWSQTRWKIELLFQQCTRSLSTPTQAGRIHSHYNHAHIFVTSSIDSAAPTPETRHESVHSEGFPLAQPTAQPPGLPQYGYFVYEN